MKENPRLNLDKERQILDIEAVEAAKRVISAFHYARANMFKHQSPTHMSINNAPVYILTDVENLLWQKHFSLNQRLSGYFDQKRIYKLVDPDKEIQKSHRQDQTPSINQMTSVAGGSQLQRREFGVLRAFEYQNTKDIINLLGRYRYNGGQIPVLATEEDISSVVWSFRPHASYNIDGTPQGWNSSAIYLHVTPLTLNDEPLLDLWYDQKGYARHFTEARPVINEIGFNVQIEGDKQNKIIVDSYNGTRTDLAVTAQCEIHHPEAISSLAIPQDPKLRLTFHALDRMMRSPEFMQIAF